MLKLDDQFFEVIQSPDLPEPESDEQASALLQEQLKDFDWGKYFDGAFPAGQPLDNIAKAAEQAGTRLQPPNNPTPRDRYFRALGSLLESRAAEFVAFRRQLSKIPPAHHASVRTLAAIFNTLDTDVAEESLCEAIRNKDTEKLVKLPKRLLIDGLMQLAESIVETGDAQVLELMLDKEYVDRNSPTVSSEAINILTEHLLTQALQRKNDAIFDTIVTLHLQKHGPTFSVEVCGMFVRAVSPEQIGTLLSLRKPGDTSMDQRLEVYDFAMRSKDPVASFGYFLGRDEWKVPEEELLAAVEDRRSTLKEPTTDTLIELIKRHGTK
jgi:hypothetical protein